MWVLAGTSDLKNPYLYYSPYLLPIRQAFSNCDSCFQIHDDDFSFYALNNLDWCGRVHCCTDEDFPSITSCSKTQGPFGEIICNFPTYPLLRRFRQSLDGMQNKNGLPVPKLWQVCRITMLNCDYAKLCNGILEGFQCSEYTFSGLKICKNLLFQLNTLKK